MMIAALVIIGGWQFANVLLLLGAARFGVVTIAVRRPPVSRKPQEVNR